MYDVLDVSRYVINYSNDMNYGISNLKLQKLLYFIQAFFLIKNNEPCFSEAIEAWDFGPVVPVAYQEFRVFGGADIPSVTSYIVFERNKNTKFLSFKKKQFNENVIESCDKALLREVIDKFSHYSATDLVKITHRQSPWRNAYAHGKNTEITQSAIRSFFNEG